MKLMSLLLTTLTFAALHVQAADPDFLSVTCGSEVQAKGPMEGGAGDVCFLYLLNSEGQGTSRGLSVADQSGNKMFYKLAAPSGSVNGAELIVSYEMSFIGVNDEAPDRILRTYNQDSPSTTKATVAYVRAGAGKWSISRIELDSLTATGFSDHSMKLNFQF